MGEKKSNHMKARITDAVFQLIKEKEISAITVEAVIKEANIARSSFYRHFSSVDEIVREFERGFLEEMELINKVALTARKSEVSLKATESMIRRMQRFHENRDRIILLLGEHGDPMFSYRINTLMDKYFRSKLSAIFGEDDVMLDFYIKFMTHGHNSLVPYWLSKCPEIEPEVIAGILNRFFYAIIQRGN